MRRIRSSLAQAQLQFQSQSHSQSRRLCLCSEFGNSIFASSTTVKSASASALTAGTWKNFNSAQLFSTHRGTSITSQILPAHSQRQKTEERIERNASANAVSKVQDYQNTGGKSSTSGSGEGDYSILHERIGSTGNTSELLDMVEGFNSKTVDERVLMTILQTLFFHVKSERSMSDSSKKDILNSVGMQKVCKILRQHCRWMIPNDLLTATKVLIFLNAPSNHPTLGTLLHLLSKHANSLTLREIIYFYFLLSRTPESPISSALQVALPIVFESQLQLQLDLKDVPTLVDSLQFAVKSSLSDKTIQYICEALQNSKEEFTSREALSILWSLTDLKRTTQPYHQLLLNSVFKTISTKMDSIRTEDLIFSASKLSKKFGRNTIEFYNEDFMNGICRRILGDEIKPMHVLSFAKPFSHMRHVDIDVLEKLSDVILANPTVVLNSDYLFAALIRSFSGANYKPEKWDNLAPIFLEHPAMTKDLGPSEICLAVDFLAIDVLPTKLISKIFSEDYFTRLEEHVEKSSPHLLLLLYNAIKLLYPHAYEGPFPPASMVEKWKSQLLKIPKVYPLRGALQAGFGGENYLVTGLFHEGFHVDHGVIMRKGGYPIAIKSTEPETLTRLQEQLPPESIIVMVKAFLSESYANNTNRLRGVNALELKLLEKLGHPVIGIDVQRWKELQDFEKIPFLMHRIREKSEKFYKNENGSRLDNSNSTPF